MMAEQTIQEFINVLSSKEPVPGGGGASALAAAVGMALGSMVANLTAGKKKYAEYQAQIEDILQKAEALTKELLAGMDKDAEAFEPLAKAYGLPKDTEEQIAQRTKVMEKALLDASLAPLSLMEQILKAMELTGTLADIGSNLAISDAGVSIQMLSAALNGASLNVFINTKLMKDREKAEELNAKTDEILKKGEVITRETFEIVVGKIR
ncbi:MAG: cyclodeaminase/cyclohydrolase family protein [Lachnospiraceae bacterium]|jgi:formiminotetrahydrofolate cyclodeaminase|nr:cyclodeaminase/cyclohydrolase family protein [Lachnospiraceae bacterium]